MRSACTLALLLLTWGVSQGDELPAPAPAALGLADLEARALHHNPTLAQAAATVDATRGKALQAGLCPNPTVGYVGDQIGIAGTAGELQGGFVQQTIIAAHKLRLSRAKYNQQVVEAELQVLAQQFRVLNGVRMRYFELLALDRLLDVHHSLVGNAEVALRTHKELQNTGLANQTDVLMQEVDLDKARLALCTLQYRHRTLWEKLAVVVGTPELHPVPLAGHLDATGTPLDWETSLKQLLTESPELHFAQAHVVHDQIAVKREQVEPVPNVNVYADTGWNFETSNTVAGVQLGMVVPLWDRNQGSIRQAKADLARSQAAVRRVELDLRQRLAETFQVYRTAWQTAQVYRDSVLPRARQALDIQKEMYQQRRAPWMDAVRMERTYLEAQAAYIQSLLEWKRAEVAICGLLLVDGLGDPPGPVPGGHLEATPRPR